MVNKANAFVKTFILLLMSLRIQFYHLAQKCHCLCTGNSSKNVNTSLCSRALVINWRDDIVDSDDFPSRLTTLI